MWDRMVQEFHSDSGAAIGGTIAWGTDDCILFINPASTLDEDTNFKRDTDNAKLSILWQAEATASITATGSAGIVDAHDLDIALAVSGTISSSDYNGIRGTTTITWTGTLNADVTGQNGTGAINGNFVNAWTGTIARGIGLMGSSQVVAAGTTTEAIGCATAVIMAHPGGTITDAIGFQSAIINAAGTITNAYGIKLPNITAGGTLNYAIETGTWLVGFGDDVTCTADLTVDQDATFNGDATMASGADLILWWNVLGNKGDDLTSAGDMDFTGTGGNFRNISGTTTINGMTDSIQSGTIVALRANGSWGTTINHNASPWAWYDNFLLDGAVDKTLEIGDSLIVVKDATSWTQIAPIKRSDSIYTTPWTTGNIAVGTKKVWADATSGNIVLTLPPVAEWIAEEITVMKIDAWSNTVTVDGNGSETINWAANFVLASTYSYCTVSNDSGECFILGYR